ncbi:hypothetical protein M422DRAFT_25021 [Sphaerobolus stellatus SS14]|nr:hypothetical protein M422DRAFT_25021 [Sphaerobolus stellatus SS14]
MGKERAKAIKVTDNSDTATHDSRRSKKAKSEDLADDNVEKPAVTTDEDLAKRKRKRARKSKIEDDMDDINPEDDDTIGKHTSNESKDETDEPMPADDKSTKKSNSSKDSEKSSKKKKQKNATEEDTTQDNVSSKKSSKRKSKFVDESVTAGEAEVDVNADDTEEPPKKKKRKHKDSQDNGDEVDKADKSKKKKRKKKDVDSDPEIFPDPSGDEDLPESATKALIYVYSRVSSSPDWKFNKARQNWIIRNIFDDQSIPEIYFSSCLKYLSTAQGNTREVLIKNSKLIIEGKTIAMPEKQPEAQETQETAEEEPAAEESKPKAVRFSEPSTEKPVDENPENTAMKKERAKALIAALEDA